MLKFRYMQKNKVVNVGLSKTKNLALSVDGVFGEMARFFINQSMLYMQEIQTIIKQKQNQQQLNNRLGEFSRTSSSQQTEQLNEPNPPHPIQLKKPPKPLFLLQKPKSPSTSYLIYFHMNKKDISAKYNTISVAQVAKLSSNEWKNLSVIQRSKYQELAQIDIKRYYSQLDVFKEKFGKQLVEYKQKTQAYYRNRKKINRDREKKIVANSKEKKLKVQDSIAKVEFKGRFESDSQNLSSEHEFTHQNGSKVEKS